MGKPEGLHRIGAGLDGAAGDEHQKLINPALCLGEIAAHREKDISEKFVEKPVGFRLVRLPHGPEQVLLGFKGIRRHLFPGFQFMDISRHLLLDNIRILPVQHPLRSGNIVHKPHRHKEQRGELGDNIRGDKGDVL